MVGQQLAKRTDIFFMVGRVLALPC